MTFTRYHVYAALLVVAGLLGTSAIISYRHMASRVETLEVTAKEYDGLRKSVESLQAEVIARRTSDQSIRDKRANTTKAIQEASHADQATADFLATPLPDGLRNAYLKAHTEQRVVSTNNH
ncbi:hypothetical protein [Dyella silvatica]|uniref:hypothetical protein n=1 Tax=Dyella silvatica TaxID=2992128 RepID=UPI002256997A|nr:hypothetical protein [Dyella silvatica]